MEARRKRYSAAWTPRDPLSVWQWAQRSVDFGRAASYDTPIHGPYDPDWMPYWREPAEALTDPAVREVIVLKCARAGGSENLLLNAIRYSVACDPKPTLYVTGDQLSAERFMDRRVVRSMACASETARALRVAQRTQHDIAFPTMDFRVTWPRARQAFKQDGWALVLADEVSLYPEYSADMARKRTASYPFAHIAIISSPDPAAKRPVDDDPIFVEHARGDCRRWVMPDPATGKPFAWAMGGRSGAGVRWSDTARREDGTWDLDTVRKTAHYETPDGTRIEEADRMRVTRTGRWEATAPSAPDGVRSYHVTAAMTPFATGSFGALACDFLTAKAKGQSALKGYWFESWAEKFYAAREYANLGILDKCAGEYDRGADPLALDLYRLPYGERPAMTVLTCDVQRDVIYWMLATIVRDSAVFVRDWGREVEFDLIDAIARKHNAARVLMDAGYRPGEVYDACCRLKMIPTLGTEGRLSMPWIQQTINPYEGSREKKSGSIARFQFVTDEFKAPALRAMQGYGPIRLHVYRNPDRELDRQLTSEERVDGRWRTRKGQPANHLWDCLVLAFLANGIPILWPRR